MMEYVEVSQELIFGMIKTPDSPGFWKHLETGDILDVYPLEPVQNILCVWCRDVDISYTDPSTQGLQQLIWTTDEWLGHIPVDHFLLVNYPNDTFGWEKVESENL